MFLRVRGEEEESLGRARFSTRFLHSSLASGQDRGLSRKIGHRRVRLKIACACVEGSRAPSLPAEGVEVAISRCGLVVQRYVACKDLLICRYSVSSTGHGLTSWVINDFIMIRKTLKDFCRFAKLLTRMLLRIVKVGAFYKRCSIHRKEEIQ